MNHPFYARGVSLLDVVDVDPAPDGLGLDYTETIERSGHSNTWLMVASPPPSAFEKFWSELQELNCSYESTPMDTEVGGKPCTHSTSRRKPTSIAFCPS